MSFSVLGGLRGRGLSGLRGMHGYAIGGSPVSSAKYGDTITYNVPGQPPGQIWLEQYVNGILGYNGPLSIPMAPYTLSSKDQPGTWISNAYSYQGGQKGALLEQSTLYITGVAAGPGPVSGGGSPIPPNGCMGSDGHLYPAADIQSLRTAFNNPNWLPAGCTPVPAPGGGGGGSTTVQQITVTSQGGSVPDGSTVGATYNQNCLTGKYRFILATGGGFATGASLPGCSQTNSANCDPQFFSTLSDAIHYALSRGETPYKVDSADEPWQLMNCAIPPDPHKVYNPDGSLGGGFSITTLLLVGAVAYTLLRRRS